jgi:hypothetical protein
MAVIALSLLTLWIFSLWLLLVERRSPRKLLILKPFALTSGTILFFVLTLASLLFIRLLLDN